MATRIFSHHSDSMVAELARHILDMAATPRHTLYLCVQTNYEPLPLGAYLSSLRYEPGRIVVTEYGRGHVDADALWSIEGLLPGLDIRRPTFEVARTDVAMTSFIHTWLEALYMLDDRLDRDDEIMTEVLVRLCDGKLHRLISGEDQSVRLELSRDVREIVCRVIDLQHMSDKAFTATFTRVLSSCFKLGDMYRGQVGFDEP